MAELMPAIREMAEEDERRRLAPYASLAAESRGRREPLEPCAIRTAFQRDRDRILHCKSFRRLKHKTQCFIAPESDHYRTRLTHTLEVSQIARTIARALRLNEDLCEAIALGHDLGHTPFGHMGERILSELSCEGFRHEEQSIRVVTLIENEGKGLNLSLEVLDGILNHPKRGNPSTLEGKVVSIADRIAYINHDIDDALRAGVLRPSELPEGLVATLGDTHGKRIDTMIRDIIETSYGRPVVEMSPRVGDATDALRSFMFREVYEREAVKGEELKAERMLRALFAYYSEHLAELPQEFQPRPGPNGEKAAVTDYIACMTDRYAIRAFARLYIPASEGLDMP
ncbi:MAG: deoxyguanosinetriphosphate triphosphohydrolase [Christensenellaceae bacterium]|jgi:dGTPase|nr:deoxyguanosinetriphosphate triphosphohydrolase [Christensenellaceae bacterium]